MPLDNTTYQIWDMPGRVDEFKEWIEDFFPYYGNTWILAYTFYSNWWYDQIKQKQANFLAHLPHSGTTHILVDGLNSQNDKQHEYLLTLYRQGVDVTLGPIAPPWTNSFHSKTIIAEDTNPPADFPIYIGSQNFTDAGFDERNMTIQVYSSEIYLAWAPALEALAASLWLDYPRLQLGQTRNPH